MGNSSETIEQAIRHREEGKYPQAVALLQGWLDVHPHDALGHALLAHVFSLLGDDQRAWAALNAASSLDAALPAIQRVLALLLLRARKFPEALEAARRSQAAAPDDPEVQLALASALSANNQAAEALTWVNAALASRPDYAEALATRAMLKLRQNDQAGALADAESALAIKRFLAPLWGVVGSIRLQQNDFAGAMAALETALQYEPANAAHFSTLGQCQIRLGQFDAAASSLQRSLQLAPQNPNIPARFALADVLGRLGRFDDAIRELQAIHKLAGPDANSRHAVERRLAMIYSALSRPDEVERHLNLALAEKSDDTSLLDELAVQALQNSKVQDAFRYATRSLGIKEGEQAKSVAISSLMRLEFAGHSAAAEQILTRALAENWGRPEDLARPAGGLVKTVPAVRRLVEACTRAWPNRTEAERLFDAATVEALSSNGLLLALLRSTLVTDLELERFLTLGRRALLELGIASSARSGGHDAVQHFYLRLAEQCFSNEYVYARPAEEKDAAVALRDRLDEALASSAPVSPLWLVAVAAYFPLHALASAPAILARAWPAELEELLRVQVREPLAEATLRGTIPRLTAIDGDVSLAVQAQYEVSPYPRWTTVRQSALGWDLGDMLAQMFPRARLAKVTAQDPSILVAGCGTGKHSIGTALRYRHSKFVAVDLSLSSLSYAKRKSIEMGLDHIQYAQADILKLDSTIGPFDLIESSGVLHHMDQPLAGWRTLIKLLRPQGLMKIALYSEIARRDIVSIRSAASANVATITPDEVRDFRQNLIDNAPSGTLDTLKNFNDFFSLSGFRDLVLHAQEHRFDLAQIEDFLREEDLEFLGFVIDPAILRRYSERFPSDPAATNLSQWRQFETDNPDTFTGMYQMWLQKRA